MKPISKSRTLYVAAAQVVLSTLAATLTPGEDVKPVVIKLLAAGAAGCGALVIALRVQDSQGGK